MSESTIEHSEQTKQYRFTAVAKFRCEQEVEASNEEEARTKIGSWPCYVSGSKSLLGYVDLNCEFVDEPHDIHWEFLDDTMLDPDAMAVEVLENRIPHRLATNTDPEQMRQYRIVAASNLRCRLEVEAKTEREAGMQVGDWLVYWDGPDCLLSCDDWDDEFQPEQYEVSWDILDVELLNPDTTIVDLFGDKRV